MHMLPVCCGCTSARYVPVWLPTRCTYSLDQGTRLHQMGSKAKVSTVQSISKYPLSLAPTPRSTFPPSSPLAPCRLQQLVDNGPSPPPGETGAKFIIREDGRRLNLYQMQLGGYDRRLEIGDKVGAAVCVSNVVCLSHLVLCMMRHACHAL